LLALGDVMNPVQVRRIIISSVAALGVGGVALGVGLPFVRLTATGDLPTKTAPAAQSNTASTSPSQVSAAPIVLPTKPPDTRRAPAFDVVRVEPDGSAVIAGRAAPGVPVELLRGDEVLGRVVADQNGEFVLIPPRLPSGDYQIALRAKLPDGTDATSERSAAVTVESRSAAPLTNLPKPLDEAVTTRQPAPSPPVQSIVTDAAATGKDGKVTLRGHATAGAAIKLYLNDSFVTSVTAGADQKFSVTINDGVRPGRYRVRLEEVDPKSAAIVAHSEQQFVVAESEALGSAQNDTVDRWHPQMSIGPSSVAAGSPSDEIIPKIITATVIRGDSLWRISQHSYGTGDLYRLIVRANRGRIRNPDLIYPKQIFVLPAH
jgi:nucleoid-associated protein YgaU